MIEKDLQSLSANELYDLVGSSKGVELYLAEFFPQIYNLFKQDGYMPQTLDDANCYLKEQILKIGKLDNFYGVYKEDGQEKSYIINKNNYYLGYYQLIWENLTLQEKAQVYAWHLQDKKYLLHNQVDFRFIINDDSVECYESQGITYRNHKDKWEIYINLEQLLQKEPSQLILSLEHECEHIKQYMFSSFIEKRHITPTNMFELSQYYDVDILQIDGLASYANNALYLGEVNEFAAEKRAWKNYVKILRAIKSQVGPLNPKQIQAMRYAHEVFKLRNYLLPVEKVNPLYFNSHQDKIEYKKTRFILQNKDYLNKLNILQTYHSENKNRQQAQEVKKRIIQFFKTHERDDQFIDDEWNKIINIEESVNEM